MKRLPVILILTLVCGLNARAQWYLFPGSPQSRRDTSAVSTGSGDVAAGTGAIATESAAASVDLPSDEFVLDIPGNIKVTLALPLGSTKPIPSSNFYDFYCGAMLAARDLGEKGVDISVNVLDTTDGVNMLTSAPFNGADVIIGPVSLTDIQRTVALCDSAHFIVSPLEPKALALADTSRVIQVPSPNADQIEALVEWISADMEPFDNLVLLKEPGLAPTASQAEVMSYLNASGLKYSNATSARTIQFPVMGKTRLVLVSDNDQFLLNSIREISILGQKGNDVALYTTSKARSLDNLEPTALYDACTRMVGSYYTDYSDPAVRRFVRAYRSLFQNEPGQFAFHGYDTFRYFVNACAEYGRQWYKKLPEISGSGLNTDFSFRTSELTGAVNTAVRRIVYNNDLSTTLQK